MLMLRHCGTTGTGAVGYGEEKNCYVVQGLVVDNNAVVGVVEVAAESPPKPKKPRVKVRRRTSSRRNKRNTIFIRDWV